MNSDSYISFHEATMMGIKRVDEEICFLLEDVYVENQHRSASVYLKGVSRILRDGSPVDDLTMECSDGEILTLKYRSGSAQLIIEWNDFKEHSHETRSYQIDCKAFEVILNPE